MVSGKSNQNQANASQTQGVQATKPKPYSDPFGAFNKGVYTPNMSDTQKSSLDTTQQAINGYTSALNQPFDINSYYNNPFYQNAYSQLSAPIQRQYQQDQTALNNNLNAKGQTGSSYDALMNNNLNQNHDYNLSQAQAQARSASADAYNQAYSNNLAGLQGMNQSLASQQAYLYQPLNMALAYQNAVAPLQSAAAGIYGNAQNQYLSRPTNSQQVFGMINSGAQALGTAFSG